MGGTRGGSAFTRTSQIPTYMGVKPYSTVERIDERDCNLEGRHHEAAWARGRSAGNKDISASALSAW